MSESGSGDPDSGSTTDDKEPSVECPTCGRTDFASNRGMRMHHARTHGESLSKTTVVCRYCGEKKERLRCFVNETSFCDMDCLAAWQSENVCGENHHQYNRVKTECESCGVALNKKPSRVEKYDHQFCSIQCHRDYQSVHQTGENHHLFNGGRALEYGPNWHRQRRKAIERDNGECRSCGVHRDKLNRDIHVHHITPRKQFMDGGEFDYESANDLDNLMCLCAACHQKWEGIPLRIDPG